MEIVSTRTYCDNFNCETVNERVINISNKTHSITIKFDDNSYLVFKDQAQYREFMFYVPDYVNILDELDKKCLKYTDDVVPEKYCYCGNEVAQISVYNFDNKDLIRIFTKRKDK